MFYYNNKNLSSPKPLKFLNSTLLFPYFTFCYVLVGAPAPNMLLLVLVQTPKSWRASVFQELLQI